MGCKNGIWIYPLLYLSILMVVTEDHYALLVGIEEFVCTDIMWAKGGIRVRSKLLDADHHMSVSVFSR